MTRAHADTYIAAKGCHVAEPALFDWPSQAAREFHKLCDNQGMTLVVFMTTAGVFCGISTQWISGHKWFADLEAVLFDEKGPHPSLKGTPHTVLCHTDFGPIWGSWGIYCLSAGSVSTNFADTSTQSSPHGRTPHIYPTLTL